MAGLLLKLSMLNGDSYEIFRYPQLTGYPRTHHPETAGLLSALTRTFGRLSAVANGMETVSAIHDEAMTLHAY